MRAFIILMLVVGCVGIIPRAENKIDTQIKKIDLCSLKGWKNKLNDKWVIDNRTINLFEHFIFGKCKTKVDESGIVISFSPSSCKSPNKRKKESSIVVGEIITIGTVINRMCARNIPKASFKDIKFTFKSFFNNETCVVDYARNYHVADNRNTFVFNISKIFGTFNVRSRSEKEVAKFIASYCKKNNNSSKIFKSIYYTPLQLN